MTKDQLEDWYNHPVTQELMSHLNEQVRKVSYLEFIPGYNSDQLGLVTAHNAGVAKGLSEMLFFYQNNSKKFKNEIHNTELKNKRRLAS